MKAIHSPSASHAVCRDCKKKVKLLESQDLSANLALASSFVSDVHHMNSAMNGAWLPACPLNRPAAGE
jgi:hypothetical protein